MNEHDQHHQHSKEAHDKAREEKKHRLQEGHPEGKAGPMNYPKWLLIIGIVLTVAAVVVWTLV